MKFFIPFLSGVLLFAGATLRAQMPDTDTETQPPAGSTLINSDELRSDEATHISDFIGNVVVIGTNFHMTCQEMKVYFTKDNKVMKIVATGDVVITQPNRVTHCGHAEYYQDSDTFDLTEEPIIYQGTDKKLTGAEIIIDRKSQKLTTKGGRTTVTIKNSSMNAATTTPDVNPDSDAPAPLPDKK